MLLSSKSQNARWKACWLNGTRINSIETTGDYFCYLIRLMRLVGAFKWIMMSQVSRGTWRTMEFELIVAFTFQWLNFSNKEIITTSVSINKLSEKPSQ